MSFTFTIKELILISPAIVLFLTSLLPIFFKVINKNNEPGSFFSIILPTVGCFVAIIMSILAGAYKGTGQYVFSQSMVIDEISSWTSIVISSIVLLTLLVVKEHASSSEKLFSEYVFLLLNSAVGMMVLSWSNDLILTFVGIEMMSLSIYLLVAISKETTLSKESAIKYFILGSFASAILLFGVSFIYGTTGTTYLHEIANVAQNLASTSRLFLVGVGLVIAGFAFKVSIFPFHSWTPDVYQGSSTPLTAFMA
ncbi:MAG: NADH-quinone oxidoreductase subunit N, partial [Bdellovibrionales bacterium]|nr:NADH-quinone oxidoreductase subunit N [Bdellovibrionales bacterium]